MSTEREILTIPTIAVPVAPNGNGSYVYGTGNTDMEPVRGFLRTGTFFHVGGTMSANQPSYIHRKADDALYDTLIRGEYALILAPRQMGKSSLMVQTRAKLRNENTPTAIIDLQPLGQNRDFNSWFRDVLYKIENGLDLATDTGIWWDKHAGLYPTTRFERFIEEVLLTEIPAESPVVLFFDEIDSVLPLPFRDDFFLTLRALFNARAHKPALERLTIALFGVASPSDLVENKTRSPYNIGTLIPLEDFPTGHDALPTFRDALGGRENPNTNAVVDRILYWTGGQPFLTQQFAQIALGWDVNQRTAAHVDAEVNERYLTGEATQNTHLRFIRDYLLEPQDTEPQSADNTEIAEGAESDTATDETTNNPTEKPQASASGYDNARIRETLLLYRAVLDGDPPKINPASESQNRLRLAGVVRNDPATGCLAPRNPIYVTRFGREWIERNLPADPLADTSLRRWQNAPYNKKKDYLLQGAALRDALDSDAPEYRTEEGREFLRVCRQQSERKSRRQLKVVIAIVGFLGAMGLLSTYLYFQAASAQRTTAVSLKKENEARVETEKQRNLAEENAKKATDSADAAKRSEADAKEQKKRADQSAAKAVQSAAEEKKAHGEAEKLRRKADQSANEAIASARKAHIAERLAKKEATAARTAEARAKNAAHQLDSERLAAQSLLAGDKDIPTATRLAYQALKAYRPPRPNIIAALRNSLLNVGGEQVLHTLSGHSGEVNSASFSPDGTRIVTASSDKTARVWNAQTGKVITTLSGHTDTVWSASFSPDGKRIVTASADNTARVWNAQTGKVITTLRGHTSAVFSASFSPDGKRIVTASGDETARVWDIRETEGLAITGKVITTLSGHTSAVFSASFSPDGTRIVTASRDKTARVWDIRETEGLATTGKVITTLSGHTNYVYSASFSPDGTRIVTASSDQTARVWDIRETEGLATTGKVIATLSGHTGTIESASFSPDGTRIVTASGDKTARVWDARTGKVLATLSGHPVYTYSASFSPDGKRIVTASSDKTARVWDVSGTLPGEETLSQLEARAERRLKQLQKEAAHSPVRGE